jgi:hypothetical protein
MSLNALFQSGVSRVVVAAVIGCSLTALATADDARPAKEEVAKPRTVEMFKAIDDKEIEVKFIPKNSKGATVLVKNLTDKPLSVKMPEAFASVPVLAQAGFGGGVGGGGGGVQAGGGGFGGGGMGMGGGGMGGGGFFNVAPEKVGKIKVATVCLEHGKRDPRPRTPIKLIPLEEWTDRPAVVELCKMLGRGAIDQRSAQAAAWHLQNDMSWQELASKEIKHVTGAREPYFHRAEIMRAMQIAQAAKVIAEKSPVRSPGDDPQTAANQ